MWMRLSADQLLFARIWIVKDRRQIIDWSTGNLGGIQRLQPVGRGMLRELLGQQADEFIPVRHTRCVIRKSLIDSKLIQSQASQAAPKLGVKCESLVAND